MVHLNCFILWQKQMSEVFGLYSSLSQKIFCFVAHDDVISVLQVFQSFTLLQSGLVHGRW